MFGRKPRPLHPFCGMCGGQMVRFKRDLSPRYDRRTGKQLPPVHWWRCENDPHRDEERVTYSHDVEYED